MLFSKEPNPLKVVVLGEGQSGKTCFIDMVCDRPVNIIHCRFSSSSVSIDTGSSSSKGNTSFATALSTPNYFQGPSRMLITTGAFLSWI